MRQKNLQGSGLTKLTYKDYLLSKHWKETRESVFIKKGRCCFICFSTKNINIHHRFYTSKKESVLFREKTGSLFPLCARCHGLLHKYHGRDYLTKGFFERARKAYLSGVKIDDLIRFCFNRRLYILMLTSYKKVGVL